MFDGSVLPVVCEGDSELVVFVIRVLAEDCHDGLFRLVAAIVVEQDVTLFAARDDLGEWNDGLNGSQTWDVELGVVIGLRVIDIDERSEW